MTLVFATNNVHKLEEAEKILGNRVNVLSLTGIRFSEHIPEDYDTLEENASQKSWFVYKKTKRDCFSDDTGLEVDALDGKPGVHSARYAGAHSTYADNVNKLLKEMNGQIKRAAKFRTVISLIIKGKEYFFEGSVRGHIIDSPRGFEGFGYDPVFVPEGYTKSFSELSSEEKNKLSHRGRALEAMAEFLKQK